MLLPLRGLNSASLGDSVAEMIPGSRKSGTGVPVESDSDDSSWMIWLTVLVVLGFVGYRYYKKKLVKTKGVSSMVPDWMKKEKGAKK